MGDFRPSVTSHSQWLCCFDDHTASCMFPITSFHVMKAAPHTPVELTLPFTGRASESNLVMQSLCHADLTPKQQVSPS